MDIRQTYYPQTKIKAHREVYPKTQCPGQGFYGTDEWRKLKNG